MRLIYKDKTIYEGQARSNELWICHDFATLRFALNRFIQRIRDFSSRDVSFYAAKADYALYVALRTTLTR